MHPSFIVNPTATSHDLTEAMAELVQKAKILHRLILSNCFDENGQVTASGELLSESLWMEGELLNDATKINDLILRA